MKKINRIIAIALLAIGFAAVPAQAQFRFGIKAGVDVNKLQFDTKTFDSDNRVGFIGGLMAEFTVPIIGIGGDISALYTHRSLEGETSPDYINIPINLKWKINIPVINNIIRPYLATGPSFAFLINKSKVPEGFKNKDIAWNVGFGVELIKHLQIGASYGIGLNKTVEEKITGDTGVDIYGKSRVWTISAAYLF